MRQDAEFNDLMIAAGVAPPEVCLIRHHTPKLGIGGMTLFDLWRDHPVGFKRYQETQKPNRPLFRKRKIWAEFVSPTPGETMFIGLFDASLTATDKANWLCDYRGEPPNKGKPVDIFATQPRPELREHIGRLRVAWPTDNVRTWVRKADQLRLPIVSSPVTAAISLVGAELVAGLKALGFQQRHKTKKLIQFRRRDLIVYVKRETRLRPLVAHPQFLSIADELRSLGGIDLAQPARTYINSNLTQFPNYTGGHRMTSGHHGLAMGVRADRLGALLALLDGRATIETPDGALRVIAPEDNPLTEKERLQAARIGQGEFRSALMIYWNGACPIARVDHGELLRASHIKPWKDSSNAERLDPFNGLLLCAHIDALFDRHLISFEDNGRLLISRALSTDNRLRLSLEPSAKIKGLDPRHLPYLAHHRSRFKR